MNGNPVSARAAESGTGLVSAIRGYLSSNYRDNPGRGCPISALVAEQALALAGQRGK
jgi:hypothetical protein